MEAKHCNCSITRLNNNSVKIITDQKKKKKKKDLASIL